MKLMDSIDQNPHEIHSQKYDLGHVAVGNTEYSYFKTEKEDSGLITHGSSEKPTEMLTRKYN